MLRSRIATVAGLPPSVHRLIAAYEAATIRQLETAGSRFMSHGVAKYPYAVKGGTTAVAHIFAKIDEAIPDRIMAGDVRSFVTVAARRASERRWGVKWMGQERWPARVQAADLALQAVIAVTICREGGKPVDPDVLAWATARWVAAGLPLD